MKYTTLLFLLFCLSLTVNAQQVAAIASSKTIEEAIPHVERMMRSKISDQVKLVGIGDIAELAKESIKFNTALGVYLLNNKNFRHILLPEGDWKLRPLNAYLSDRSKLDTLLLDSLIHQGILKNNYRTEEFRALFVWVKKHNLLHPNDQIMLFGISPNSIIPPANFLATYIYPIDPTNGRKLAQKWGENYYPDSLAMKDIESWYNATLLTASDIHQKLLLTCKEDIEQNKAAITITSIDQQFPQSELNKQTDYIANQILKKTLKKAILYGSNAEISKCELKSKKVLNDQTISSTGKILNKSLKQDYFACVTDFADSARVLQVDFKNHSMDVVLIPGSEQTKKLFSIRDSYFMPADIHQLKPYVPKEISLIIQLPYTILPDNAVVPMDALFLFEKLAGDDLLTRK